MPITNLPTFEDDEILAAGKLNELRNAIETKFTGAITGSDLAWPLVAQGNLDMNGFQLLGVTVFRGVYDASEYASLQACIDAAEAQSGGIVFLPPGYDVTVDTVSIDSSNIIIMGAVRSCKVALQSIAANDLFVVANNLENVQFLNFTLDGVSNVQSWGGIYGAGLKGLRVEGCILDDFNANFIELEEAGGLANRDCHVLNNQFIEGGSNSRYMYVRAADGFDVRGNHCTEGADSGLDGFEFAAASGADMIHVSICDNSVLCNGNGIKVTTSTGSKGESVIANNTVDCTGVGAGNGISAGQSGGALDNSTVTGNVVCNAQGFGLVLVGDGSTLSGNVVHTSGSDGILVSNSDYCTITGNVSHDNTSDGFLISNCDYCSFTGNVAYNNGAYGFLWSLVDHLVRAGNKAWDNTSGPESGTYTNADFAADAGGLTPVWLVDRAGALGGALGFGGGNYLIGGNNGSNPSDGFRDTEGGSPLVHRAKTSVAQADSSPKTLWTVPKGEVWIVHRAYARVNTAWGGTPDLDLGILGGDTDGFIDGSAVANFPAVAGFYGQDPADRGALLYGTYEESYVIDATATQVTIIATITVGGGAGGTADLFIEHAVIEEDSAPDLFNYS
jgi:parallel beta-helix repeat protein